MSDTIAQRVQRVIAETQKLPAERVEITTTFKELGIDSLDGLNILFTLEEEFSVEIPDDAGKNFTSVRDVVAGIERLLARTDA